MSAKRSNPHATDAAATPDQAALWVARRDRGLTPAEQDEYLRWLTADPRRAEIMLQHAAAFERMMQLYEWQPGQSAEANPDLFAPPKRRWRLPWRTALAAAAALAVAGMLYWGQSASPAPLASHRTLLRVNERQALPDGSVVELKDGSTLALAFSPHERRVRLTGEAHFAVAKSDVPFVVQAGGVAVRAVGTAFNVRAEAEQVDVLVTEGRVLVSRTETPAAPVPASPAPSGSAALPRPAAGGSGTATGVRAAAPTPPGTLLVAGQRAVVAAMADAAPSVRSVSAAEMETVLEWKIPRLQFFETPLAVAIEEFNRRNRLQLVLGQRKLAGVPIGGTFRIDNVEGFVRLLEITLDIRAVRRGDYELVLTREQ